MPHVHLSHSDATLGLPRAEQLSRNAVADTMLAWERFLTGHPRAAPPAGNFVVSSWQRSMALGVNPTGRTAPILAHGDAMHALREHHHELLDAAAGVVSELSLGQCQGLLSDLGAFAEQLLSRAGCCGSMSCCPAERTKGNATCGSRPSRCRFICCASREVVSSRTTK